MIYRKKLSNYCNPFERENNQKLEEEKKATTKLKQNKI